MTRSTEAAIQRSRVEQLLAVTREIVAGSELPVVLASIARAIRTVVEFDAVAIALTDAADDLEVVVVEGPDELREHMLGRVGPRAEYDALMASCEPRGRLLFLVGGDDPEVGLPTWRSGDDDWYARRADDPHAWGVDDGLYAPLRDRDGVLMGLVSVDLPVSGRAPDDEQCAMLELLARQAEQSIEAHRRLAQTEHNERIFRRAFDSSPAPEAVVDPQQRLTYVNRRFVRELGQVPDVASLASLLTPAEGERCVSEVVAELLAEGADRTSGRLVASRERADGTRVWYQVRVHAVLDPLGRSYRAICSFADITAERETQAWHERAAAHDPLTGLLNRRGGAHAVAELLTRAESGVLGVLACDLDGFKALNDEYGHGFGDDVLVALAPRLRGVAGDDAVVMRQGGDEFAVLALLPDDEAVAALADRMVTAFGDPVRVGTVPAELGVSVGVASAPVHARPTVSELLDTADAALLRAKRAGKARFELA
jgi:diguanylate cyclase (GGDEF)-like protein/PAS domain S-box-containing protein